MSKGNGYPRSLGSALKKARTKKRLSREKLAREVGISPTYLTEMENGLSPIPLKLLAKLAARVGTQASCLMQEAGILEEGDVGQLLYSLVKLLEQAPPPEKLARFIDECSAFERKRSRKKN